MYCRQEVNEGRLVPAFKYWQTPPVPFYLIYHQNKYQPMRLKMFISYVMDQIKQADL